MKTLTTNTISEPHNYRINRRYCQKAFLSLVVGVVCLVLAHPCVAQVTLPQWWDQDIGTSGGSAYYDPDIGIFTITADGRDIWGKSDDFHYVYWQLYGDGAITARVIDVGEGSDIQAKCGVMIRESLTRSSPHIAAHIIAGYGGGAEGLFRLLDGGLTTPSNSPQSPITPPYWVRVERQGDVFAASISSDGMNWTQMASETINMQKSVFIGLSATSHVRGEFRNFTIGNVELSGDITDLTSSILVSVPGHAQGRIMTPGQNERLDVLVTDETGIPIRNEEVLFFAPTEGATGSFSGESPDEPGLYRTQTDTDGIASATFIANETAGVYLVDAVVIKTGAAVSFGMTNVLNTINPILTAEQARSIVTDEILSGIKEDQTLRIHGPVLLQPEASVVSGIHEDSRYSMDPITVEQSTWFFWIDEMPSAKFAHPTRFVLLDASKPATDASNNAVIIRQHWWPQILSSPGEGWRSLVPPSTQLRTTPIIQQPTNGLFKLVYNASIRTQESNDSDERSDTCVIALYGPSQAAMANDVENMVEFFKNTLHIPEENIYQFTTIFGWHPAAKPWVLKALIEKALTEKCKKVYIYISAHGNATGVFLADANESDDKTGNEERDEAEGREDKDPKYDKVSYEELGEWLEPLSANGTEVCIIIDACSSANAISVLKNRGIKGEIVTAADFDSGTGMFSLWPFGWGFFTSALIECWKDSAADIDIPDGSVTLREALDWTKQKGGWLANWGNPQIGSLHEPDEVIPLPDVFIDEVGRTVPVEVQRPPGHNGQIVIGIEILDSEVAQFADIDNPGIPFGEYRRATMLEDTDSKYIQITGVSQGSTYYVARSRDENGREYYGRGIIYVDSQEDPRIPVDDALGELPVSDVFIDEVGQTKETLIQRPTGAYGDLDIRIAVLEPEIAELANLDNRAVPYGQYRSIELSEGENSKYIHFVGWTEGYTYYEVLAIDENGSVFYGKAGIQVGVGFFGPPSELQLRVEEKKTVLLERKGLIQQLPKPVEMSVEPEDPEVVGSDQKNIIFLPGQDKVEFTIEGLKEGTTKLRLSDPLYDLETSFNVTVKPIPPDQDGWVRSVTILDLLTGLPETDNPGTPYPDWVLQQDELGNPSVDDILSGSPVKAGGDYNHLNDNINYARTSAGFLLYNKTDGDLVANFDLQSDDGVKVLVNGELVHLNSVVRAPGDTGYTEDHFSATLKPGWNVVVVGVYNVTLGCGFRMRITNPETGEPFHSRVLDMTPDHFTIFDFENQESTYDNTSTSGRASFEIVPDFDESDTSEGVGRDNIMAFSYYNTEDAPSSEIIFNLGNSGDPSQTGLLPALSESVTENSVISMEVQQAPTNNPAPFYFGMTDTFGNTAVQYSDPAAIAVTQPMTWEVPLKDLTGVSVPQAQNIFFGVGDYSAGLGLLSLDGGLSRTYNLSNANTAVTGTIFIDNIEFHPNGLAKRNLLSNPGFENGSKTGWTHPVCDMRVTSDQVHSGNYSAYIYNRTDTWQGPRTSVLNQMQNGKTYHVSFWVRLENAQSDNIGLTVLQTDAAGMSYTSLQWATGYSSRWVQLSGTFTLNATGTVTELQFYVEGPKPGVNFYVDDALVEEEQPMQ